MRKERFVIPIIAPLFFFLIIIVAFSGYMAGTGSMVEGQEAIGILFAIIISLPAIISVMKGVKGIRLLALLSLFAYAIESTGIITGFPYGAFHYGSMMGTKLFGIVPIILPFAYVPLVLGAYYVAQKLTGNRGMIITITAMILVAFDLVLDPGAAALEYWVWENPGLYYGIPLTNYLGWVLSSIVAAMICHKHNDAIRSANPKMILSSIFLLITFWTFVAIALGMIIPIIIGMMIMLFYGSILLSEKAQKYHHE